MTPRRLRTADYSAEARARLGEAVAKARHAAGYKYKTTFARAADVNLRSLDLLENGSTGVGQTIIWAVARALPGWTEDTPRTILEGGQVPPVTEQSSEAGEPSDAPRGNTLPRALTMTREEIFDEAERLDRALGDGAGDEFVQWAMNVRRRAAEQRRAHMSQEVDSDRT